MNVDENLAMMNADENMDSNAAEAQTLPLSAPVSNRASDDSGTATTYAATTNDQEKLENTTGTIVPIEPTTGDQSDGNEEEPHGQY
jgi:hypothetical protein